MTVVARAIGGEDWRMPMAEVGGTVAEMLVPMGVGKGPTVGWQ